MKLETEKTDAGMQTLAPGVTPLTKDRLVRLMASPDRKPQLECNVGLFDEGTRNQSDLLDFIKNGERNEG